MRVTHFIASAFVFSVLAACSPGLPEATKSKATEVLSEISNIARFVETDRKDLERILSSENGPFLAPYAIAENWTGRFDQSLRVQEALESEYERVVTPVLERDDEEEYGVVSASLMRLKEQRDQAIKDAHWPINRAFALYEGRENADANIRNLNTAIKTADHARVEFEKVYSAAVSLFPDKANDLKERVASYDALVDKARNSLESAVEIRSTDQSNLPDWEVLTQHVESGQGDIGAARDVFAEAQKLVGQLNHFWSRTLIDMREDCTLRVGVVSWDSYYDWPTENASHSQWLPIACSEAWALEEMVGDKNLLDIRVGWGKDISYLNDVVRHKLLIIGLGNPKSYLARGDDEADFWIEEIRVKYYHRYAENYDGQVTETDWVEVDEKTYEEYYDDLMMDIASKPQGAYDSEAYTQASPPGMAFIGNPMCGAWVAAVWQWNPMCGYFGNPFWGGMDFGYNRAVYDDWDRNYRGREAYYGKTDANGRSRWGTTGTATEKSSVVNRSSFNKTGGLKTARADMRAAGSAIRGGGPGGKGK